VSARLNKARRNREGEQRDKHGMGYRHVPKHARTTSMTCKCLGCRCTKSIEFPLQLLQTTRREATCNPCRRRQHTRPDGRPYLRIRPDRRVAA
jgi:hypothetical protein